MKFLDAEHISMVGHRYAWHPVGNCLLDQIGKLACAIENGELRMYMKMNEVDHVAFPKTFPGNGFERISEGENPACSGSVKLQKISLGFRLLKTIVCDFL